MRRFVLILVMLVVVGATGYFIYSGNQQADVVATPAGGSIRAGQMAPDVELKTLSGEIVKLSQYRGKVVILNFWATWCPPCRAEMPSMEKLYRMFPNGELVMLAVNVEEDGAKTVPAFLAGNPHSFPILFDQGAKAQRTYGVFRFPESFIIGPDGQVVDKVVGAIDWVDPQVVGFIKSLQKGL